MTEHDHEDTTHFHEGCPCCRRQRYGNAERTDLSDSIASTMTTEAALNPAIEDTGADGAADSPADGSADAGADTSPSYDSGASDAGAGGSDGGF